MSSLLESRWAATPEPEAEVRVQSDGHVRSRLDGSSLGREGDTALVAEDNPVNAKISKDDGSAVDPNASLALPESSPIAEPGLHASRWADTPDSTTEVVELDPSSHNVPAREDASSLLQDTDQAPHSKSETSNAIQPNDGTSNEIPEAIGAFGAKAASVPRSSDRGLSELVIPASLLEPPRLKKRISFRGKGITITIPRVDYRANGLMVPMTHAEIQERLQRFEDDGYNVRGHDLSEDNASRINTAQVREIYPDEAESRTVSNKTKLNVVLPDLEKWKAYTDRLTEQKLAALGVTLGDVEPASISSQDMTRPPSNQYPPLPFSPPLPTTSAGSVGRPGLFRGHSHTMSMAAPASPLNSPFGHMHRHSIVAGAGGFPTLHQIQQSQQRSPGIPGLGSYSPQLQLGFPSLHTSSSPAPIGALRQDLVGLRGPGSPLSQQVMSHGQVDSSGRAYEPDRRSQYDPSLSMYQPIMPVISSSHASSIRPTPVLPEVPEDENESELEESDNLAYVPPHKRMQANTDIAVPTPRGHRHNISEGLERDLLDAENRQQNASKDWVEVTEEETSALTDEQEQRDKLSEQATSSKSTEKDPLAAEHPVQETNHVRKKSASRFNVAAPSFTFNPGANFQPGLTFQQSQSFEPPRTDFTFQGSAPSFIEPHVSNHNRDKSSGSFNAAAPAFQPATSEFSFSLNGHTLKPSLPQSAQSKENDRNIVDELPSIFGKVEIPDIVKPGRRSKAVAIVRPTTSKTSSEDEFEDDEGRVAQGNAKRKHQRKVEDDGDQVPLFAQPMQNPMPAVPPPEKLLRSNDKVTPAISESVGRLDPIPETTMQKSNGALETDAEEARDGHRHGHKHSTSLSALAKPFEPPFIQTGAATRNYQPEGDPFISDLQVSGASQEELPQVQSKKTPQFHTTHGLNGHDALVDLADERTDPVTQTNPSFDEIDAIMRQINDEGSRVDPTDAVSPIRLPSPGSHPMKGVTYLAEQPRSDAQSVDLMDVEAQPEFAAQQSEDDIFRATNGYRQIRQLNKAEEQPTSDWSGILSPPDEDKLQQRSNFFDSHVESLIDRIVEQRLQPLENGIKNIHSSLNRRARSSDQRLQRWSSNVESDADDEDEISDEHKQRPISRGRDKRLDQMKAAMLEALREQSPVRSQTSLDIADLHSILADMKVSFARAASASLELDDIRAVVEDSLNRQSQALVPANAAQDHEAVHKRELSELEGRLNETLAGALEEANHRRSIEEREAEARRLLRLAEEEVKMVRRTADDEASKTRAMEQERDDLLSRLQRAEDAREDMEEKLEESEAGKNAMQATLDEYRMSSNKWRQDIEEGKRVRDELEQTLAEVERQNAEYHESSGSLRQRLQRLHSDLATAAGQLASDKAVWTTREDNYRGRIEALESQQDILRRERDQVEDELRAVRAQATDAAESRRLLEQMRAGNVSMHETIQKLQGEISEQQALSTRYERQFHDAQESGRAEVYRTRMSLETEVEAANHQVNLVRAELESEVAKIRMELENTKMEAETAKARHEHLLEEEESAKREALRKVNHANSVALDEARHRYEAAIQDLTTQQTRAITNALEDKQRVETFLHEKLGLSDAKLQHFQDRVAHLEDRLEVARSAAQAAAVSAKASRSLSPAHVPVGIPEKVSPQALRESILVLQEQLQDRESHIEQLQAQLQDTGPAKLKERDTEVSWLRELLAVRSDELTELVKTISRPNFDRAAVRDVAIRMRANLDMEQQEQERFRRTSQTLSGQALASLSNFATPKAAQQLTTAFNKWRTTMESSALKAQSAGGAQAQTPSKPQARPRPASHQSGLMTPPASNLRSSPVSDLTKSLPLPRLQSRSQSAQSLASTDAPFEAHHNAGSAGSERPDSRLFRAQSYDGDADDRSVQMDSLEDDDLDAVTDSEPPAFRSLASELGESTASTEAAS